MYWNPKAVRALVAGTALVTVVAVLLASGQASAQIGQPENAVVDWNAHALSALVNASSAPTPGAGQTPPVSILHLAMVQTAVYDAVNMIEGSHQPYLDDLPRAPKWASKTAAVATAAHDVLVGVVVVPPLAPEVVARLDGLRDESIAAATASDGSRAVAAGIKAGKAAAEAMLEERQNDGRYGTFTFALGGQAGQWRPIAPANINDPFAWVARVDPFLLESPSQFRTKGPHALTSDAYTKEYNEVKALGGNGTTTVSARTPEQLAIAQFFVVNPIELFNRTFRTIAESERLTLAKEARLFATLNLAAADALINCWDDKAHWSFWRPVTAIRLGNDDGNDATAGDPAWTSFVAAPPYPDHTSGYNCATSAFMHSARAFFGKDKMQFGLTATIGTPPAAVTRNYIRYTDVIRDTINARVYQGIHFRAADVQGAAIGKRVAHWLDQNFLNKAKKN
jgi:hypothetical protein